MADFAAGASYAPQREFRIGQVISRAISIYGQHIVIFTLIAAIVWLPVALLTYFLHSAPTNLRSFAPLITSGLAYFLQPLSTAIILFGAFQHMRGQRVSFGEC